MSAYDQTAYSRQLTAKVKQLETLFAAVPHPPLAIFSSPERNYRLRAEFKIWHHEGSWDYAMFTPGRTKKPFFLNDFPPAVIKINELMPLIKDELGKNELLTAKLFQLDFLTATTGEVLITCHYHRRLENDWLIPARTLAARLKIKIIARAKKQKLMTHNDQITEKITVADRTYHFIQKENTFSQPNGAVNRQMLSWVCNRQDPNTVTEDLLELYCGNGNFTLPLCRYFRRVFATEISKNAIAALEINQQLNSITNLNFARLSAAEMIAALIPVRQFNRLRAIDLTAYNFTTLFIDPPRSGLDAATLDFSRRFAKIIYISCNPLTLKENITELLPTHVIDHFAFFDQFPYTPHCECGIILSRRQQN